MYPSSLSGGRIAALSLLLSACFFCASAAAQSPAGGAGSPPPAESQPAASAPAQSSAPQPAATPEAGAGGKQPGQEEQGYTLRQNVNEVNLIFTVTDRHGRFVRDLKQSDFALLDDQKAPARVSSFAQQTNLPLRVGLLIDASTSIRQRFQFEQEASIEFLLSILKSRSDRAFVMGFDVTPTVTQDWTNSLDLLETGVNKLRPGGGTALYDAVYTGCRDRLLDTVRRGQEPVRRAMVLISDGDDNQSRAYLDDAIKMCQRAETIIYTISTNVSPSRGHGDDVLEKMSEATGGRTFHPQRIEDMANSFRDIEEELRSQYALTYAPADFKADGSFRTIYLVALDRRYTVRARKGYFAPRE